MDANATFHSAAAARAAFYRGDWDTLRRALTPSGLRILSREALAGRWARPTALDAPLLYKLRGMSAAEIAALPAVAEGLENVIAREARAQTSRDALLAALKSKRYARARLSRVLCAALLDIDAALLAAVPTPPYARVLGFRESARPLLARLRENRLPLLANAAAAKAAWGKNPCFQADARAYDLWALAAGQRAGGLFTEQVVRV